MARIKLELPETFSFRTEITVRITDLNYGGHLGNADTLVLIHEARVRFLKSYGYSEIDIEGYGTISPRLRHLLPPHEQRDRRRRRSRQNRRLCIRLRKPETRFPTRSLCEETLYCIEAHRIPNGTGFSGIPVSLWRKQTRGRIFQPLETPASFVGRGP